MRFNEATLESAIIELLQAEQYVYVDGKTLHKEMRDVLLRDDLRGYLRTKYKTDGITESEIASILLSLDTISTASLYDANKTVLGKICNGFIFTREDRSQKDIFIELIDFEKPANNVIKVVNQLEIHGYEVRIPDAIIYINGLPLVVFEFKSAVKENATIHNAFEQLTIRYCRDIPELFKYNAFVVISDGANNKYGSIFSAYDFFYGWRKVEDSDKEADGINSLYSMMKGLFRQDRLLAVIKDFIFLPDTSKKSLKIVCRYPQYFAATKLLANIKAHMKPRGDGKGGTYFGATGCGKSFTMLFLSRLLMRDPALKSPTIILITDRNDLDSQLSEQFVMAKKYIGDETIESVETRDELDKKLKGRTSGGVFLTTIQKFSEDTGLLSRRENIICISDEAHRSQVNLEGKTVISDEKGVQRKYGFAKYLHDSFPNAVYVGFTGTPIDATIDVFGPIIDSYTMIESVQDEITVNLVYEGRAAKVYADEEKLKLVEQYYDECEVAGANEYQIEKSKQAILNIESILGDPDRLQAVAEDFVSHYEKRVFAGGSVLGKAMFVCASRPIAYALYKNIKELRPQWMEPKLSPDGVELTEQEKKELKAVPMLNMVMTRNADDDKVLYNLLGTQGDRKELDRQFKEEKSNFKIAIVVDMWITGFDVPCLDTMYIDKPLQRHTLIQTISRVNRVYAGKDKGLIVDYFGIKKSMNKALKQYTNFADDEFEGVDESIIIVRDQLEVLRIMFLSFDSTNFFTGSPLQQLDCLNRAVEFIQATDDLKKRFMAGVKRLKSAFNLCSGSDTITDGERDFIHFYISVRAVLVKLTKGEAPDMSQMNRRAKELLDEAIISDGVEELFRTGKNIGKTETDIFSEEYLARIVAIQLPNTKIKILERLLNQSINEFKKVNKIKAIEFAKALKALIDKYNDRSEVDASSVLDDVAEGLADLFRDLNKEKNSFEEMGITFEEKAFYDILKAVRDKYKFEFVEEKLIALAKDIKKIVDEKAKYTDWASRADIKAEFKVDIVLTLAEHGYPPVTQDEIYKEVFEQAENFKKFS